MTDDLVKRLRSLKDYGTVHEAADRIEKDAAHIDEMYGLVAAMNADHTASKTRIEKLEAALREIVDLSKGMSYLLGFTPADIARNALEPQTYVGQQDDSALKADCPAALSAEDIRKMNHE